MFDSNQLEKLTPMVERAASATAAKWPSYISEDDLAGEIWVWLCGSGLNSVTSAMKTEGWEGKVYTTMLKVASSAASVEDRQTNGYTKEDTYVYSVRVIESLLESVFTYEDWQSFGVRGDGQPTAKGQVNETGDVYAMLVDVKAGLAELNDAQREVLYWKYHLPGSGQAKADAMGISKSAFHNRAVRAVEALRDVLGRVSPADLRAGWSERREVIGNEHSQVMTERQYEG